MGLLAIINQPSHAREPEAANHSAEDDEKARMLYAEGLIDLLARGRPPLRQDRGAQRLAGRQTMAQRREIAGPQVAMFEDLPVKRGNRGKDGADE